MFRAAAAHWRERGGAKGVVASFIGRENNAFFSSSSSSDEDESRGASGRRGRGLCEGGVSDNRCSGGREHGQYSDHSPSSSSSSSPVSSDAGPLSFGPCDGANDPGETGGRGSYSSPYSGRARRTLTPLPAGSPEAQGCWVLRKLSLRYPFCSRLKLVVPEDIFGTANDSEKERFL